MVNTLPLYQTPTITDAWHNVTSPGGYEWWYFDAEDLQNDRRIVAILYDGYPFHPEYVRRYARFSRNPTRVTPPRASEYLCAHFAVYHAGQLEQQFKTEHPLEQFEARRDSIYVQMGPNRLSVDNRELKLWLGGSNLTAQLKFRDRSSHEAFERPVSAGESRGEHSWIIANAYCEVEGEIRINDATTPFRARGYHDHQFGSRPIGKHIERSLRGRVLLDDRCVAFFFAQPRDGAMMSHVVEIDSNTARDVEIKRTEMDWSRTVAGLRYPAEVHIDDVIRLSNPRPIDPSKYWCRAIYDATVRGRPAGHALCEIVHPSRV